MVVSSRDSEAVLFLDWVSFPKDRWNAASGTDEADGVSVSAPPILKVSALVYDVQAQRILQDEVSYCVKCEAVQRYLNDQEVESVLGMSKLVYLVATGLLETILPALLDKLDLSQVVVAVWDRERFRNEMQPHLEYTLGLVDGSVARVFSRLFVLRDALRYLHRGGGSGEVTSSSSVAESAVRAVDAAEMLGLKLKKNGSELESMYEVARAFNADGTLFKNLATDGMHILTLSPVTTDPAARPVGPTVGPSPLPATSSSDAASRRWLPNSQNGSNESDTAANGGGSQNGSALQGAGEAQPFTVTVSKEGAAPGELAISSEPNGTGVATGDGGVDASASQWHWLRLRGLPWEASLQDVVDFLSPVFGTGLDNNKIHILQARQTTLQSQGRCSGEAYIEAPSEELRDRCIKELHGNLIGRRWIEVFKSSLMEFEDAKQRCQQLAASEMSSGGILRLRGLPWGSTEYEVMRFFQDGGFAVETSNIVVPSARGARCSGEAWVDLRSATRAEDARRTLHRQCIGSRYIEIFPSNHKEFFNAQKAAQGLAPAAAYAPNTRLRGPRGMGGRRYGEGPYDEMGASGSPVLDSGDAFLQRQGRLNGSLGMTATAADVYHAGSAAAAAGAMGAVAGGSADARGAGAMGPMTIMSLPGVAGADASRLQQAAYYFTSPGRQFGPSPTVAPAAVPLAAGGASAVARPRKFPNDAESYPFTVLRLRGLPYGSNENHIVQFFLGFSMTTILPSTVPVDGRPSGEAYVEFVSPEEALRAFQLRQGARIEHRYIELFPASKQEMEYAAAGLDPREIRLRLGY
eukprot:Blabericola_migrator_1__4734@NODE_2498_length_2679_cov_71_646631_g1567_i0_p1_GENE_NODE_2498_length_2679_cov_71_646631_g1567_i0NODE_2498_length_2679_cov_71_646631_g1567_i0_p1_ORF_typecomplete_len805_score83_12RRM_1/PF00076_22/0_001RRM_1/PF00076_22/0_00062RRM_1/PF00076_22/3_8e05RRM_5/PF13893_6/3_1e03RRM_5/PF13893_6/1_9RRM_5/PF13893_6/70RRM_7/PF16367_5/7_5e02RRM_7/PF16367_5/50RRM_7/PF16367_5/1_5e02_NODE_2498_length_2679_cov_71_646631_g1567_i0952509